MQRHVIDRALPSDARGAAIALGNFDGVHLGHRAVIASAARAGAEIGAPLGVALFVPHPRKFLQPQTAPFRLQSADQRARALADLGVDHFYEIGFNRGLFPLTDREFAQRVLAQLLGAKHVSVGSNFRFGTQRMGDVAALTQYGGEFGFSVDGVPTVVDAQGETISSTAIREHISRGDMERAASLLGRPWAIEGVVLRGFARGRTIRFPTINLALGDYLRPLLGVYAVRVDLGDEHWRAGVANVGLNPTTGVLPAPLLEAHIFDFDGDLYDRWVEVQLLSFLRPEAHFESMEAMARQIEADAAQARALLA